MGHGCWYTSDHTGEKAFWLDFDFDDDEFAFEMEFDNIIYEMKNLGYEFDEHARHFYNGLAIVNIESTWDGQGMVFKMEPRLLGTETNNYEDWRIYDLFMANHERMYNRLRKYFVTAGYTVRMATSGYTATTLKPETT